MNFSIKSFPHPYSPPNYCHWPRTSSRSNFTDLEIKHIKSYLKPTLASYSAALAVYLLFDKFSTGSNALAALAGTSALLYLGLLIESSSLVKVILNLIAIPSIFILAHAGLSGTSAFLVAAFLLHAFVAAIQMENQEKERKAFLYCWASFNTCLALLL